MLSPRLKNHSSFSFMLVIQCSELDSSMAFVEVDVYKLSQLISCINDTDLAVNGMTSSMYSSNVNAFVDGEPLVIKYLRSCAKATGTSRLLMPQMAVAIMCQDRTARRPFTWWFARKGTPMWVMRLSYWLNVGPTNLSLTIFVTIHWLLYLLNIYTWNRVI